MHDKTVYPCANTDTSKCKYKQLTSGAFPKVTALDFTSGDLVITGTGFFTNAYKANVSVSGIEADTVTINSATKVTAKWIKGMPPKAVDIPILWFNKTGTKDRHYALVAD